MDGMSSTHNTQLQRHEWGPQHQQVQSPPTNHSFFWKLLTWFAGALFLHGVIDPGGTNVFNWCINAMFFGWIARLIFRGIRSGHIPIDWLVRRAEDSGWRLATLFARYAPLILVRPVAHHRARRETLQSDPYRPTAQDARDRVAALGGGAYLGVSEDGQWMTADPESAVMVLGPPRSGKTSAVMIPAVLGATGPVISTSTKPDVMEATMRARAELGEVWLFDPSGKQTDLPEGVRMLRWSPVGAAGSWDQALIMARAMTACTRVGAGTTNENHWTERAGNLLAPLLFAAHLTDRPIEEVLLWTLRQDLAPALEILAEAGTHIAASVLVGIQRTDARERSSIFSAAAGVLSAYNADATRATATEPNFDPDDFARSTDTIYITAPEQYQVLCAPLIVGLLEEIRHSTYDAVKQRIACPTMFWAIDEAPNIAPIHDMPALVSQAGGQNLQVMIGLQDLSQARTRWGDAAADGFMSLFQTRLVLNGIADSRTLESISLALGEYDRELVSTSTGTSESGEWFSPQGKNESTSYQTQRQRTLIPGEIAQLPDGCGLLLRGASWGLVELTQWYLHDPWASIGGGLPLIAQ
jgi:type IV secretion system protein VirD4